MQNRERGPNLYYITVITQDTKIDFATFRRQRAVQRIHQAGGLIMSYKRKKMTFLSGFDLEPRRVIFGGWECFHSIREQILYRP